MAIPYKAAFTALRLARTLPAIPLAIGALAIMGCAKVVNDIGKNQPLTSLAGSEWGLADTEQFIAFKSKGEVIGHGGCNRFFGTYTQDGTTLKFGPLASTKMACMGGKMQAEAEFMKSIQSARRFEATHFALAFIDDKGETLMRLQRRDWD